MNDISEMKARVQDLIEAPSCCPEAKEAGREWLKAVGTIGQEEAADNLIEELLEDVNTIDDVIAFAESDAGKAVFGENAEAMLQTFKDVKAAGGTHCPCDACQAGVDILENQDLLFEE